jgi:hypothetical protein
MRRAKRKSAHILNEEEAEKWAEPRKPISLECVIATVLVLIVMVQLVVRKRRNKITN